MHELNKVISLCNDGSFEIIYIGDFNETPNVRDILVDTNNKKHFSNVVSYYNGCLIETYSTPLQTFMIISIEEQGQAEKTVLLDLFGDINNARGILELLAENDRLYGDAGDIILQAIAKELVGLSEIAADNSCKSCINGICPFRGKQALCYMYSIENNLPIDIIRKQ